MYKPLLENSIKLLGFVSNYLLVITYNYDSKILSVITLTSFVNCKLSFEKKSSLKIKIIINCLTIIIGRSAKNKN